MPCGADDFVAFTVWVREKRDWLAKLLDFGDDPGNDCVPTHHRFNAIFAAIEPAEFERCFLSRITALHNITAGQLVAIYGKMPRHSYKAASSNTQMRVDGR